VTLADRAKFRQELDSSSKLHIGQPAGFPAAMSSADAIRGNVAIGPLLTAWSTSTRSIGAPKA